MKTHDPMTTQPEAARGLVGRVRAFVGRHAIASGVTVALGVAMAIFVLVYFQPQKLFIDDRISESLPTSAASPSPAPPAASPVASAAESASPPPAAAPVTVAAGAFRSLAHATKGTAKIIVLPDGSAYVRLEDFQTDNGPDLFVYLTPHDGTAGDDDQMAKGALNLGRLKGNIGDQNYTIPAGTDLSRYNSVLIWCKRFTTGFGVASLKR